MKYSSRMIASAALAATLLGPVLSPSAHADAEIPAAQALQQALAAVGPAQFTAPDYKPGLIRHVVLFRYGPQVTPAQKDEVKRRFLALATLCQRDGKPYVVSIETGAQMSGEGADQGYEQGFTVTFRSEGDRNYYVGQPVVTDPRYYDPAHQAFKDFVGLLLHDPAIPSGVLVFDYAVEGAQQ